MTKSARYIRAFILLLFVFSGNMAIAEDKQDTEKDSKNGGGFMETLKDEAQKAKKMYRKTSDKIEDWSKEKMNDFLNRLASYRPVLHKAGFEITGIRVRAGIIPRATVVCSQEKNIPEEKREELLEEHSDKEVLKLFLNLLFKAYDIEVSGYSTEEIWVTLSVTPHSTAILAPKEGTDPEDGDSSPEKE